MAYVDRFFLIRTAVYAWDMFCTIFNGCKGCVAKWEIRVAECFGFDAVRAGNGAVGCENENATCKSEIAGGEVPIVFRLIGILLYRFSLRTRKIQVYFGL